jgi:uncharacterized protein YgbK (DUF1537 family)
MTSVALLTDTETRKKLAPAPRTTTLGPMPRSRQPRRFARWGIIADDLTGATDVAAAFAVRGFEVLVLVNLRPRLRRRVEVVALTTNSRHDPPSVAQRKVRRACRWLQARRIPVLYKKIDSTVKGNIVVEVETICAAAGFDCAVLCPANPTQGRIVRHGVLRVRGDASRQLTEVFAAQGLDCSVTIHAPVSTKKFVKAIKAGARFVIADATNRRDLATLAGSGLDSCTAVLMVGSAGMAASVAEMLAEREVLQFGMKVLERQTPKRFGPSTPPRKGTRLVLLFAGSRNLVTQRQLETLALAVLPRVLKLDDLAHTSIGKDQINRAGCLIVRVPTHQRADAVIFQSLRRLMPLFRRRQVAAILLTGGDTALLVCRWLRVAGISVQGEIVPGLAWGRIVGGAANGLPVCTKPGGFGDERSLVTAVEFFFGRSAVVAGLLRSHSKESF